MGGVGRGMTSVNSPSSKVCLFKGRPDWYEHFVLQRNRWQHMHP